MLGLGYRVRLSTDYNVGYCFVCFAFCIWNYLLWSHHQRNLDVISFAWTQGLSGYRPRGRMVHAVQIKLPYLFSRPPTCSGPMTSSAPRPTTPRRLANQKSALPRMRRGGLSNRRRTTCWKTSNLKAPASRRLTRAHLWWKDPWSFETVQMKLTSSFVRNVVL